MILGKPTGITLKAHTDNVLNELELYLQHRSFVLDKYELIIGNALVDSLQKICRYHDLGKKHSKWQDACQREFEEYTSTKKVSGKYLGQANVRHEIFSLIFCRDNGIALSMEEIAAIGAHHGKLSTKHEDKWKVWSEGKGKEFWKLFKSLSFQVEELSYHDWVLNSYRFDAPRAILQFADRRASAKEMNEPDSNYASFKYTFNSSWEKRPVQQLAEKNAKSDLLLLRAPTGAGKTDASLLWAYQQINVLKRADRLVIALPTRFTSNALALNISENVSETGLYHSTAKHLHSSALITNAFAKLLETPVTVCTIDHLLISLSKTKEEHHQTFFNLANSCLVIDEADFYDEFTQANLLILLETLRILNVPVLLMSASLPQSSVSFYQRAGFQDLQIYEDSSDSSRERCIVREIREYEDFDELRDLFEEATTKPSIIYINTVDKAVRLKRWFSKHFPIARVTLYHSRFTEPDKTDKEELLLEQLGKNAWTSNQADGIVILTQIGEMSVNISADFMITEACPIDRLVQRIGRLSRFAKTVGQVVILKPLKNGKIYPAPYGTFEDRKWKMNEYFEETLKLIECKTYNANDFVEMVNYIYRDGMKYTDKSKTNVSKLRELIKRNWLILPHFELEEDEDAGYWRTRNITGQTMVLVMTRNEVDDHYNSYTLFEREKIARGVTCPTYLVKKNLQEEKLRIKKIRIRGEEENVILLTSMKMYSTEYGLNLSSEDCEDQFL